MKEQVFVSAVLYVHNEYETVRQGIIDLDLILGGMFQYYEIVVVNDASTDLTLEKIREVSKEVNGNMIVISLSRKHGIEKGMTAGLIKSMGDFVFEFETTKFDFSSDIIPNLYRTALTGFDIVVVSPSTGLPWTSKMFYKFVNKISYLELDLRTESTRVVSRRALNAMLNLKEKVRYRKALYAYTGYSKKVLTYQSLIKQHSARSGINRENISTAFDVIVSFSNIGLKLSHYLSIVFLLFSLFMAGYALFNYFFNKNIVEGWTTLMILISFGFTGLFFIVGMLGEYISRILIEIQNRPSYTTQSVDNFKPQKVNTVETFNNEVAVGKEAH
ncbi:glycosyl transferase [Paenibacillus tyrfis]|uniref:glycosyltransferase n=1 Tax=Paenibacillus tyrfis TaxID=1501230 RepID=UPI0024918BA1|nr:glycosyltransferase [Paenibacillus tyrfis]GLI09886.1 glycosyl transferase [Paenibacillus tyrfis]